ncbi:hypothetical protein AAEX63_06850 [Luteococcus sp. H138]|uniref:hypothetical protein n=1 Tax=unclassified Luteococcus TaxID=2639923 RepID=UPI00313E956D
MTTSRSTTILALSTVALLSLSACGGDKKESAAPASSSSTVAVPGSDASSAGATDQASTEASGQSSDAASADASAAASEGGAASGDGKSYTDAQLQAMLKGVKVNGVALQPAPAQLTAQIKKVNAADMMAQSMKTATVTPDACKTATLANAKLMPASTPLAVSGAKSLPLVIVRTLPSGEDAKKLVEAANTTADACKNFSMTMSQSGQKVTVKGTTQTMALDSASSQTESGQKTSVSVAGQSQVTTSALGHVDNVFIQITDMSGGKITQSQLNTVLEDVAKAVAAKK